MIEPAKARQLFLWWLLPAVPRVPRFTRQQCGGWWSRTDSSMYSAKVRISGLNLGNVVTEKTTLPGFLDGLGQLLVLLHTDPCVWGVEDDTRVGTNKLFQELHIPKVNMQLVIPADGARIPSHFVVTNACLSGPLWWHTTFVVAAVVSPHRARAIAVLVFF